MVPTPAADPPTDRDVRLQDPASGRYVTAGQHHPAPWDDMLRAGGPTDNADGRITLPYTDVER